MIAGIPGTGIGGMLYMLLAFWMIVVELQTTARGRSTRARWRTVYPLAGIALGMLAMISLTVWGLTTVLPPSHRTLPRLLDIPVEPPHLAILLGGMGMLTALGILTMLMLGVQVARWCCHTRIRQESAIPVHQSEERK